MRTHPNVFGGPIDLYSLAEDTGVATLLETVPHNLILNEASDIVAKLVSGDNDYRLAAAYFLFTNNATAAPATAADQGQAWFDALSGSGVDFLRVPLVISASLASTDPKYRFNRATFTALTSDATGQHGTAFSQTAGSEIIGVALAATPGAAFADDLVFCRFNLATSREKLDGLQLAISYPLTF